MVDLLITSRKNSEIRAAAQIASSAKERLQSGLFFVEGARLCQDAAESGAVIEKLFFTPEAAQKYADYLTAVRRAAKAVFQVEEHVAQLLAQTKSSQGVFCLCRRPPVQNLTLSGKWAALENIQDPSNLGAIMRTVEAMGLDGLLVISGCDLFSPKAVRASMGAVFRMKILTCSQMSDLLALPGAGGMTSFAAVPDASAEKLGALTFPTDTMIFIGNEGNGLSEEALRFCSRRVTIPMRGRAESLNAAAAAAICLWELSKS